MTQFAYTFAKSKGAIVREPKRYPRPWERETQGIGKGAIPIADFEKWWNGE